MRTERRQIADARGAVPGMRAGVLALIVALAPATATGVAAQQGSAQSSGAAVVARDTLAADTLVADIIAVDSTLLRLRERLRLLDRAPGADSAAAAARADSLENLEGASSGRPGMRSAAARRPRELPDDADLYTRLRALEGYATTEFSGREAEYVADEQRLYLFGDSTTQARVVREGEELRADSVIEFDEAKRRLEARGNPVFAPSDGDEVRAEVLFYNLDDEVGAALGARSQWDEGATWIVTGDLPEIRPELAYGHDTRFTSCELDEPHYHFATDELKIVRGSVLVARPVRLYFGDVPVAWLPFIAQSLNTGRASGLLTPRFSVNDIVRTGGGGYRRRLSNVGFYWAMSDYADASVALDWFDNTFTSVTGSMRYRWAQRFLQGAVDLRQFWRAEGGTELTLNTAHSWEMSERMNFRARAAYASSTSLVRQNSFNPQEVTQSIDSEGGLSRRFDWGNLTLNGNRRQFLSDDRVVTTFPSVNLSLKTLTLFAAPQNRASWFNNLTLGGSGQFRRTFTDLAEDQVDSGDLNGSASGSLNLGNLSISGQAGFAEQSQYGVVTPVDQNGNLRFAAGDLAALGARAFHDPVVRQQLLGEPMDLSNARINWSTGIDYQQNLVGSTTFSPRISLSGERVRNDTSIVAQNFVSGPTRLSFGAQLRGDMYGFFPGFAGFERIRHKVSPSFSYDYSPSVQPTALQEQVFGSAVQQPRNVLTFGFNQTFEAKRRPRTDSTRLAAEGEAVEADGAPGVPGGGEPALGDVDEDGFRRPPRDEIITLLALRTSSVTYDFVADSSGRFVDGFSTTQLTNNITSDYLRGLTINMAHDLFERSRDPVTGIETKRFAPQLQSLNFAFSLNNNSSLFRWLGLGGGGTGAASRENPAEQMAGPDGEMGMEPDPLGLQSSGRTDEASIVPGMGLRGGRGQGMGGGAVGQWSANFSYALNRPRASGNPSQMLQMNVQLQPTTKWQMSWRTAFDLEANSFADHSIGLTRELHRWQANFDFVQTATGNWSFRFEVRLMDNQELKFDYQQRSREFGRPSAFR